MIKWLLCCNTCTFYPTQYC